MYPQWALTLAPYLAPPHMCLFATGPETTQTPAAGPHGQVCEHDQLWPPLFPDLVLSH